MRTVFVYVILATLIRLMGKRQIGELEVSEFIVSMLLSELAAVSVADLTIPFVNSLIPILLLFSLEMLLSFLSLKSLRFKRFVGGRPSIIIDHGVIDRDELRRARLSLDELLTQLRLKDVTNVGDVEYGILEDNGQLSVIKFPSVQDVTRDDLGIKTGGGMMHALIVDGTVSDFALSLLGKDRSWLDGELEKRGAKAENVFLFACGPDGKTVFQTKEDKKK